MWCHWNQPFYFGGFGNRVTHGIIWHRHPSWSGICRWELAKSKARCRSCIKSPLSLAVNKTQANPIAMLYAAILSVWVLYQHLSWKVIYFLSRWSHEELRQCFGPLQGTYLRYPQRAAPSPCGEKSLISDSHGIFQNIIMFFWCQDVLRCP